MKYLLFALFAVLARSVFSQPAAASIELDGIPCPLEWVIEPDSFAIHNETIAISAAPGTNMFYSPSGHFRVSNMPKLLFSPDDDFTFSAKSSAEHRSKWDAAMLVVYIDEAYWAKFCFENESPTKNRMVTVVTNEISDDAYSDYIPDNWVYMRISKKGKQIIFSYSLDEENWVNIRYFRLNSDLPIRIGLASQSPVGEGLTSVFSEIHYQK
ncbi:DUF1349 domain-containing protein [Mangrovibacterium diazotrophicum]|uniref:DUF1349 domain-containing protein n=1 Tax=Mangrovibacterium diazotrophicum TaxID=1261403 RepID=A0A419W425_9BACT|nr:DUF1349 domain-containing protein [Mangrovibacterium diazotrophicum]RKD90195.1 hypothetical protein BC643_0531 [Mangrovibacterium diazotrophicum]